MVGFPNAKINLGLHVVRKRDDGYHDIETVFMPVPLCDVLEVVPSDTGTSLLVYGDVECGATDDNLVLKAYRQLARTRRLPPVSVSLYKNIPSEAGMGGGSSDAAFMLRLLNDMYNLQLSQEELQSEALQLGADCPFFIRNTPCYATGKGDVMTDIDVPDLSDYHIIVVKPPLAISTAQAFAKITPRERDITPFDIVSNEPVLCWRELLCNDFEDSLFPVYPILSDIKAQLYGLGADYASMTGSGSAVYGLFRGAVPIVEFPNCFVWTHSLYR